MTAGLEGGQVAVVGAGVMGTGIAQVAAAAGHEVLLFDSRPEAAGDAIAGIEGSLRRLCDKGRIGETEVKAAAGRLKAAGSLADLSGCKLAVEAIVEDLGAKAALFAELEEVCAGDAVLASNTSAIPLGRMAEGLRAPERLAGLHFFNPAPVMRLVEVVRHDAVADGLVSELCSLMRSWGKEPIVAAPTPGFVANRLSRPFFIEALRLHEEEGIAVEVIDECMRCCAGFRMGPFELMDLIGNDVNCTNNAGIHEMLGNDPRIEPGSLQAGMVADGRLGRKSGSGFYDYGGGGVPGSRGEQAEGMIRDVDGLSECDGARAADLGGEAAVRDWSVPDSVPAAVAVAFSGGASDGFKARVRDGLSGSGVRAHEVPDTPGLVVLRILAALVAVAADALADGVASPEDMEKAMRLGMNHPRGPKGWLELLGAERVRRTLAALDAAGAPDGRYAPCDLSGMAHG